MRKIICLMLSVVIILSFGTPVFGAADSEMTNAVKTAKSRLNIPAEFTEFSSGKYESGGRNIYELMWSDTDESPSMISASVLASGEIVSYYYRDGKRDYDKTGIAAYSPEEYLRIAKEWISKANPSYVTELDFDTVVNIGGVHSYNVNLTFGRKISGITVYGDCVYLTLDKYNGRVISMNSQWTHPDRIDDAKDVISDAEAGKILGDMANLTLRYHKRSGEKKAVLMYTPERFGMMIDAKRGAEFSVEYVDSEEGDAGSGAAGMMNDSATNEKAESALTREEIENIEEMESLLSKQELSSMISKMYDAAASSFKVKSVDYRQTGNEKSGKKYEARVYLTNGESESANAVFDAESGELKSLYTYLGYKQGKKATKKREDMKNTSERFIEEWASDVAEKACIFGDDEKSSGGYFTFTHNENGIEYQGNRISIRVDENTGKILSFTKNWDKELEFDNADGAITREEATEEYITSANAHLCYIANKRERYATENAGELVLVYRFDDDAPAYVDAKNGACYDWSMGQESENPEEYELQADIRGHWAEKAVKTLAENGIVISYDEKFCPDEAVTQKEIALVADCFGGGYRPYEVTENDYISFVDSLVRQNIIKNEERNPDKKVTREECTAYLVRMFGYGNAAELSGIYKTGFSDETEISVDRMGYVAIAKALKLISGNNGKFNPKKAVTRAELSMMLYNALEK